MSIREDYFKSLPMWYKHWHFWFQVVQFYIAIRRAHERFWLMCRSYISWKKEQLRWRMSSDWTIERNVWARI